MKKTLIKSLSLLLATAIILSTSPVDFLSAVDLFSINTNAATYSGTCGDNITWTLDADTRDLVITGTGEMPDWANSTSVPWYSKRLYIGQVTISDGITNIGNYAFYNFPNIKSITIPESVNKIGDGAFHYCTSFKNIYYTGTQEQWNTVSIGTYDSNFKSAVKIFKCNSDKPYYYTDSCGDNLTWTFYTDNTLSVTGSGDMTDWRSHVYVPWYSYCSKIETVSIEIGVTSIGAYAFYNCSSLKTVSIESSVTKIGGYAFNNCSSLNKILYPGTQEQWKNISIGSYNSYLTSADKIYNCNSERPHYAIGSCGDNLTWTLYTDGELIISGTGDMYNWNSYNEKYPPWPYSAVIKTVTVESGVTSIGSFAFADLGGSISTVTLPDTVTKINDYAFYSCNMITDITLPKYLVQIGYSAFSGCTGLTDIVLPEYVKTISDRAFDNCSSLASITLPDSVTTIGSWAFCNCSSLTSITVPDSVTDIGEAAFSNCTKLASITLSDSVTIIRGDTFNKCLNLESINIPKSVTSINGLSFTSCSGLKRITIPRSVTNIANAAFRYCANITDVYYEGSEKMWNKIAIGDENNSLKNATIHFLGSPDDDPPDDPPVIPAGTVSAYVKSVSVYPGETFEVNVFVNDNPGFVSTLFNISYDTNKLTLVSVENGEIFPDSSFEKGGKISAVPYTVLWIDGTAANDYTADGKLLTLTFKASQKASAVDTQISITADEDSTFNSELKPVTFEIEPGTVSIEKRLTGDVNCDGILNLKDVILIKRSLSSGWNVTVDSTYADANGNGHVNVLDVVLLTRYLAGWDVTLA